MKKFLLLSIILLGVSLHLKAVQTPHPFLECTGTITPISAYNDDLVTVDLTIKNTSQSTSALGSFHMGFWEGCYWWMNSNTYQSTYFGPGQSRSLTFTGRIPSADYIKIKGGIYSLRIYFTEYGASYVSMSVYVKNGIIPFSLL